YGVVRVFDAEERRQLLAQRSFAFPGLPERPSETPAATERAPEPAPSRPERGMLQVELLPQPELNDEQALIVNHPAGPLLVLAGPGTGKTRVIAQRIARWVRSGVSPRTITAITFTRRAARELRERLDALLGDSARAIGALTFHALGLELLRSFAAEAGLPPEFSVLDETERARALDAAIAALGCPPSARWAAAIAAAKSRLIEPESAEPEIAPVYAAYESELAARAALDFDDLVRRAVQLLELCPAARAAAEERCRHLCIDEWQDVSLAQERFVQLLAPAGPDAEVCAVGDPDQSIYGFRGSDPACVERFVNHYAAAVLPLSANYRCPVSVVRAATQLIERAPGRSPRELRPQRRDTGPIERVDLGSERDEAEFIAAEIERALGGTSLESLGMRRAEGHLEQPFAFHEIAVLFRVSAQAEAIEQALDRAGIPHQRAGDAFIERPEVAALLERLRSWASSSALELPRRGEAIADRIRALAREASADFPAHAARRLLEAADLLATLALPFGGDASAFLADLPLWQAGELELSPERVALL
ncbi:MAG TPA: ATP-dependent helicase, partial [Polyangiaceae bacterium]|nr:ATP-dependent helicase [Polyangiaceae bacterium]